MEQQSSHRSVLEPLRQPLFRALWIASVASNIGTWIQEIGEGWLMTSLTTSPAIIGLLETSLTLPIFLLSLPAGALADIFDRRRILIVTQLWMLVSAALMSVLAVTGVMTPWLLLTLTFTLSIGTALNGPAWQALIPELITREELPSAIALGSAGFNVARAIGPAIGGLIIAASGVWAAFALNAISFFGVIIVLYGWKRKHHESILPTERIVGAMRAGVRYVRHSPPLQAVLVRTVTFIVFASAMWATLPFIARHEMNLDSLHYGLLPGSLGIGAVTGAIIMTKLRGHISTNGLVQVATIVFADLLLVLAFVRIFWIVSLAMAIGGIAWMMLMSSLNTSAQVASPSWVRARAMALYILVFFGGFAGGATLWGFLASFVGTPLTLSVAAAGCVAGVFTARRFSLLSDQPEDLTPSLHWPEPVLAFQPNPDDGPVMVTIEYSIKPEDAWNFSEAMQRLSIIRKRDGAIQWGLFQDMSDPSRYVETFIVESWAEHLRQHERITVADRDIEEYVHAFHEGSTRPAISHYMYSGGL